MKNSNITYEQAKSIVGAIPKSHIDAVRILVKKYLKKRAYRKDK